MAKSNISQTATTKSKIDLDAPANGISHAYTGPTQSSRNVSHKTPLNDQVAAARQPASNTVKRV